MVAFIKPLIIKRTIAGHIAGGFQTQSADGPVLIRKTFRIYHPSRCYQRIVLMSEGGPQQLVNVHVSPILFSSFGRPGGAG